MTWRAIAERLGLALPIVQAPMAGVSSPAMSAAVSDAGALGSLGLGAAGATGAETMIAAHRALTRKALHVNVFCHAPAARDAAREAAWIARWGPEIERFGGVRPSALHEIYTSFAVDDAMQATLLRLRPSALSFHFGLPSRDRLEALRDAGILLFGSATSLAEARVVEAAGLDAIIAQGWEAGGHRGVFDPEARDDRLGTLALVRVLVRATKLPVIAAGGIMDGSGIAAALRLGASAAQLGTAFVGCDESLADAGYRAALASDAAHHTTMTRFVSGRPARCLSNRFTALDASERDVPAYPVAYDLGKALHAAAKAKGESGYGAQWAGQGAPLSRPMPAARLVETLAEELRGQG